MPRSSTSTSARPVGFLITMPTQRLPLNTRPVLTANRDGASTPATVLNSAPPSASARLVTSFSMR